MFFSKHQKLTMTQKPIIFDMDYTEVKFVMIKLKLTHMLRELEDFDGEEIADLPRSYVIEHFYSNKEIWEEFRKLLSYNDTKKLTIHNTFYYPGMYFQKRFPSIMRNLSRNGLLLKVL